MIDIDTATKWAELFARVGFPAFVALFLLWRLEASMAKLTEAVSRLSSCLDHDHVQRDAIERARKE